MPTTCYEVLIRGRATAALLRPFLDGFTVHHDRAGDTRLVGDVTDPAHLHGLLAHLTSVGAVVISVGPIDPSAPRHDHPRTTWSAPMITVSHLTKRYGDRLAVDDLTFAVPAGRVTGFVGPNGAGKSTTMRMMVGLTRPDSGEVRYDGVAHHHLDDPARTVGVALDARCTHPGRTARGHLRAAAALSSLPAARVEVVLAEVGLTAAADQLAGRFSLGMRQRLALAAALLGDPGVLLLDEPSNGLDPNGICWMRNYLRDFAARGGTVFISSHLIAELAVLAEDLVVVGGGRLIAADSVRSLTGTSSSLEDSLLDLTRDATELAAS